MAVQKSCYRLERTNLPSEMPTGPCECTTLYCLGLSTVHLAWLSSIEQRAEKTKCLTVLVLPQAISCKMPLTYNASATGSRTPVNLYQTSLAWVAERPEFCTYLSRADEGGRWFESGTACSDYTGARLYQTARGSHQDSVHFRYGLGNIALDFRSKHHHLTTLTLASRKE